MFVACHLLFVPINKPSNSKKRTCKDTSPQHFRKLIYKKKKMWKFIKLNKIEHAKFMYKKAYKECKAAYKKNYISELDNICKWNNTKSFF